MAGDNHGASSLFRRAEQIRRWKESETNRQEYSDSPRKKAVKFSDECIFLAAAAAGDRDELAQLLQRGADINTVNQDGITALHAACIDNNLAIVEFLVDAGADINRSDMEGWTPLHATASCGSLTMAKFLIDRGSDLSLVNNDGELPVDVVDEPAMATLLYQEMAARGVDGKAARSTEERCMLEDVTHWLQTGCMDDAPHPKTGASALHVAAAKGYSKVMRLLLDAGADVNATDHDGWTPLHAAVHWGQTEAVELLCDCMADLDAANLVGQTPSDLADDSLRPLLDEMRRKQLALRHARKRKPSPAREPSKRKESHGSSREAENGPKEGPTENGKVSNCASLDASEVQSWRRPASLRGGKPSGKENNGSPVATREPLTERSLSSPNDNSSDENKLVVSAPVRRTVSFDRENRNTQDGLVQGTVVPPSTSSTLSSSTSTTSSTPLTNSTTTTPSINLAASIASSTAVTTNTSSSTSTSAPAASTTTTTVNSAVSTAPKASSVSPSRVVGSNVTIITAGSTTPKPPQPPAAASDQPPPTPPPKHAPQPSPPQPPSYTNSGTNTSTSGSTSSASPMSAALAKMSPGSVIKNFFKSFVPPSRDDESETQRKANARQIRSSRRSTQGVSLDDLKTAENLYKPAADADAKESGSTETPSSPGGSKKSEDDERRPSWRLKVDDNDKNRFCLEDVRGLESNGPPNNGVHNRNNRASNDDKTDEENGEQKSGGGSSTSGQSREGSQAAIQRRKKPKRRSTGVVHVDMDEIDPDKRAQKQQQQQEQQQEQQDQQQTPPLDNGETSVSGERTGEEARKGGSSTSLASRSSSVPADGEIDYKKLYEEQLSENERLVERLRVYERDLRGAKEAIESANRTNSSKLASAETDRREKRALERKLSEMEEELRQLQKLKTENEKLKAENRALTRVVSKLTSTAALGVHGAK